MRLATPSVLSPISDRQAHDGAEAYYPRGISTFEEARLEPALLESLVLKFLFNTGQSSGRRVATELGLPFGPFPEYLRQLKNAQILTYTNSVTAGDFIYSLTDLGRARARSYLEECSYVGTAPVPFDDYLDSVAAQTIANEHPKEDDLRRAFEDLLISEQTFGMLGPAINSGRGLFLYGFPGNGKTSIAERITLCFGTSVWIPRVLCIEGQLVKLFDPANHEEMPRQTFGGLLDATDYDRRWIHIKRPTIVAGGELRMEDLEIRFDPVSKVSEAPLQLKSNLGSFLIDDFGRQRMQPVELLNRWIVPLEKRYDFLSLANGKKVRVPFDQLIIFSTNLEPRQLVDEAFLRRIPYKIHATDPTEQEFRQMIDIFAVKLGFDEVIPESVDHLINYHYKRTKRPFRCCQPRDLLLQVRNYCIYNDLPLVMKPEYFDFAVKNYFTVM
ncbi:AAA family ATPase [Aquisphaera insulae]|uniref:AAA family ATPase n=1 Tax=Aquisphaera insulae TaxID=2712864 RepID=UPI002030CC7A|nr:AAA family ATPase [Aquisphaera insulae]